MALRRRLLAVAGLLLLPAAAVALVLVRVQAAPSVLALASTTGLAGQPSGVGAPPATSAIMADDEQSGASGPASTAETTGALSAAVAARHEASAAAAFSAMSAPSVGRAELGVEDQLMPQATVLVRGKIPGSPVVDVAAILADVELQAQQVGEYAVWAKALTAFGSYPPPGSLREADPFPATVQLRFAASGDGSFLVGAEGPAPDVLSVVGSLYWGDPAPDNFWDSVCCPNVWDGDDGFYEPRDIGLVGMAFRELTDLQGKAYLSGLPTSDYDFRSQCGIAVKQRLGQALWVAYYPIYVHRGDEYGDFAVDFAMNHRWCQFSTPYDNGTATRSAKLSYVGPEASYIYAAAYNNNGEQSWITLDGTEVVHQYNWGVHIDKFYNQYPTSVGLGGMKTWSQISPAITVTALASSLRISDQTEDPSLGERRNPPPDVVLLQPEVWVGEELSVFSVHPSTAGNAGPVSVVVRGAGFESGATVRACLSSDPATCVLGSEVTVSDPSELTARFDFGGAAVGSVWDVTVTNPDESIGTLLEAITLAEPVVNLWVDVLGPDRVRVGQETSFAVRCGNAGNVDSSPVLVMAAAVSEGEDAWASHGAGLASLAASIGAPLSSAVLFPGPLVPGQSVSLPLPVIPPGMMCGTVAAKVVAAEGPGRCEQILGAIREFRAKAEWAKAHLDECDFDPECEKTWSGILQHYLYWLGKVCEQYVAEGCGEAPPECDTSDLAASFLERNGESLEAAQGDALSAGAPPTEAASGFCAVIAIDPNDKAATIGYAGGGRIGEWTGNCPPDSFLDLGYVSPNRPLQYVIRFENIPSATAEAQDVVVTDTPDADLDWSSLEVGESRTAGQVYAPTVALDPGLRTITWTFSGVNLPPNQTPPEGEGSVSFSVGPAAGLPTGTEIGNYASIVFDVNPAMCTNAVLHIIDAESPTSAVEPLPAYQRWPLVPVRWAGEDGSGDSGVSDYMLYASEDGGPAYLWHTSMTPTGGSAVFHGGYNHTYGFYSRARDHVQNLEGAPDGPDATITTGSGFIDIAEDDPATPEVNEEFWAFDEIYALALAKTSEGYEDETYRPGLSVPRDQMAVYVARTLAGGKDKVPSGPAIPAFSDVASDHWAYDEIEYCHSQGVVEGYEDDTYRPTLAVNRGTMAVYMARAMVAPAGDAAVPEATEPPAPHFPDVGAANESWCYKHVEYCYDHGVVKGYEDGTYRPGVQVHRDQMAVYVQRAFGLPM